MDMGFIGQYVWRYVDNIYIFKWSDVELDLTAVNENASSEFTIRTKNIYNLSKPMHKKIEILGLTLGENKVKVKDYNWYRSLFYRYSRIKGQICTHKDFIKKYGKVKEEEVESIISGVAAYIINIDPSFELYLINRGLSNLLSRKMKC
jgi:hypothetical protein